MVSTRKIFDEALGVLDQFHIIFPWDKDPDLNETKELFFSAGENENDASLNDSSAAEEDETDTMGTCQGVDEAKNGAINEYVEFYNDNNEDCHVTEVVQSWTGLDRKVLATTLADRNKYPGTSFCKCPGKHPEPVMVPKGPVRSQCLVLDISRRSNYLDMDQIRAFLDCHVSPEVTRKELEELGDLEKALD